jgi:hypothetical protein
MLEIKVNETIHIADGIPEAVKFVEKIINEWLISYKEDKPLSILIQKKEARAPPLSINVKENINVKSVLR